MHNAENIRFQYMSNFNAAEKHMLTISGKKFLAHNIEKHLEYTIPLKTGGSRWVEVSKLSSFRRAHFQELIYLLRIEF